MNELDIDMDDSMIKKKLLHKQLEIEEFRSSVDPEYLKWKREKRMLIHQRQKVERLREKMCGSSSFCARSLTSCISGRDHYYGEEDNYNDPICNIFWENWHEIIKWMY